MPPLASSDRALAARLEAVEAENVAGMARLLGRVLPGSGAAAEPLGGGFAVFAGLGSPMTHAVGIGMNGPVSAQEFDRLEEFFRARGSASVIDLCPLADLSVVEHIQARGYRILEFNNLLARRTASEDQFTRSPEWRVEIAAADQMEIWTRTVMQGFEEREEVNPESLRVMSATCSGGLCWLGMEGKQPAGAAAMVLHEGAAAFYGDATLVHARRRGLQSALISARLEYARDQGCDLAFATVLPGSSSHRNYERAGFQLIYMRVNLIREWR